MKLILSLILSLGIGFGAGHMIDHKNAAWSYEHVTFTYSPGGNEQYVGCPKGDVAVGGGIYDAQGNPVVADSFPAKPNGWGMEWYNANTNKITVLAICSGLS